jgi:serine phosphatase RsbU (regulator of sigma subunit)/ligand-binding sensor domain-containing protein
MTKKIFFFFTISLLLLTKALFAQELDYFGAPFITQYLPKEYDGSAQNWDIVQDKRGVFYIGNTDGLLEFDGVSWRKYYLANKSVVRSMDIDSTGNIWVGGADEFGWFAPDSLGDLSYHSLSEQLPDSIQNFTDIWKTVVVPSGVYFFSRTKFFRWHEGKLTVVNRALQASFADKAFNEVYIWDVKKALCRLKDTTLVPLLNEKEILKIGVGGYKSVCEYQDNKLLVGTMTNGFFIYDIKSKTLSQPELDPQITAYAAQNTGAYTLCKIHDDAYAMGTFKGGILVLNAKLKLIDVVNTMRGIQSNTIYALFVDKKGDLWATLQNGIARIDINNPLRSFGEKQNMNAFGLDAITFEGKKYVATMNGCFVLDKYELSIVDDNHTFTYIPNLDNCWDLRIYKNKLFAAGFFGLSQIVDGKAKQIFNKTGAKRNIFSMQTSKKYSNHLFLGYQDDLVALELVKQANSEYLAVKEVTYFPNIVGEVRSITEDKNGDLWLGMNAGGVVSIQFAGDTDISDYEMHFLDDKNGLPSEEDIAVVTIDNKVNFLTTKGIYKQIDEKQEISTSVQFGYHEFWKSYSKYDSIRYNELHKLTENLYVANGDDITAFLSKKKDSLVINKAPFAKVNGVSNLIPEQKYMNVCTSSSFYMYNLNKDSVREDIIYNTLIRKVSIAQDSLIFNGSYYKNEDGNLMFTQVQGKEQIPVFEYSDNSIKVYFSAAFYDASKEIEYTYFLEGFNDKWTHWSKETNAVFTNVPEGKYTFKVKAKNIYEVESTVATYQFEILAPWYRTFYAYVGYLLLLTGFIWLIVRLNSQRLTKEKIKLENTVIERTAEIYQQKEEILVQAENLLEANDKLEGAYTNVQLLSEIGQKITTKLSVEDIIETVYEHVNLLMDANFFAIGIAKETKGIIEFHGTKENGEALPYYYDKLSDKSKLSAHCYNTSSSILLKDISAEIGNYLPVKPVLTAGNATNSLIYLPIGTLKRKIGVISVQSLNYNAYSQYHLNILRNIAIYTSIALENTAAYSQIKRQHGQIKSSVSYASTIQNAILPSQKQLDELFENFVLYRPKDIVSGDFYWLSQMEDCIFVAVVDCTGHGVPGAFMSMIGSRLLSEIVNERKILETDMILEALHIGIKKVLHQEQTNNTDGMDICLCKIKNTEQGADISFSGAKNHLFVYENDKSELVRIRGDKKTIGGNYFENLDFTQTNISVKKGDMIYLTSDGFADQNNKERKKITTLGLMSLLKKEHDQPLTTQKLMLETELETWQGEELQRDDITILGIKI